MNDTSFAALLLRTVVALGVVLAIIAVAYLVMRSRGPAAGRGPASGTVGRRRTGRRRTTPAPIEVVGRAGLTRTSSVVALRFGDRVVLVSATEQGPATVLAEMPAERWDELTVEREPIAAVELDPTASVAHGIADLPSTSRPRFLDALREATTRHA